MMNELQVNMFDDIATILLNKLYLVILNALWSARLCINVH